VKTTGRSILRSAVGTGGGREPTAASVARRDTWLRRLPLLPAFVYVVLVTQIPFALTIYYSFFSWNLLKPGSFQFTGLDNYTRLLTDESLRTGVLNTVVLTFSVIAISVVLGLAIASMLNSEVFGKGLMRTLMIAPFLIMPTAGALIWKDTLLNPLFGLLPYLLTPFGLGRVDWVNRFPMATVVAVEVWRWTPFMMLIILAGLQSQNPELLEAAHVDGANALQAFRRITLPLVRPFIELGALLGSLFVVQTFDSIYMLTYGGPGEDTTNLPFLLYLVAFQGFSIGQASAIGVVAVILTTIVATFALRTLFSIFHVEARR
jgi:sorbitol/mannitol transport system permease protein